MLPYAEIYANKGFKIFPLAEKSKDPFKGSNGFKDATSDINQIRKWWTEHPMANIGMATGNGIAVIDVDEGVSNNGVIKQGEESLRIWQEDNGVLPETLTSVTGKGGKHLIYNIKNKCCSATNVIKDVDVRSDGGYIVLPLRFTKTAIGTSLSMDLM